MTVDDLLRPTGRLDPTWVEEDTLEALIAQAEAATEDAAAQTAFVYSRAYGILADDWAARAATRRADDIAETHSPSQIAHWAAQARAWLAEYNRLTGNATTVEIVW